jgi:uncharacterized Tic20 family protein
VLAAAYLPVFTALIAPMVIWWRRDDQRRNRAKPHAALIDD